LAFWPVFQTHKVERAEGVASNPVVQSAITAQKAFFIVDLRAQGYGLIPVAAAGLHHSLKKDGAAIPGGGIQGEVGAAGAGAAVELKPQTIQLLRWLYALAAKGTNGRPEAVTRCMEQKDGLLLWRNGKSREGSEASSRFPLRLVYLIDQLRIHYHRFFLRGQFPLLLTPWAVVLTLGVISPKGEFLWLK